MASVVATDLNYEDFGRTNKKKSTLTKTNGEFEKKNYGYYKFQIGVTLLVCGMSLHGNYSDKHVAVSHKAAYIGHNSNYRNDISKIIKGKPLEASLMQKFNDDAPETFETIYSDNIQKVSGYKFRLDITEIVEESELVDLGYMTGRSYDPENVLREVLPYKSYLHELEILD